MFYQIFWENTNNMRELSLNILDLVQNSVEAGAKNVFVQVDEDTEKDIFLLIIEDDGKGMSEEFLETVKNPFTTKRTTRKVGMGIPLVDMSVKNTGGFFNIKSKLNKGTSLEIGFGLSHIDRPPLGNIAETIKVIVVSYQNIRFRYSHKKGAKNFCLDTKEIRDVLGDEVDFSNTLFRQWLDDYLKELKSF